MKNVPDIDWLRRRAQSIHFFGLGFVQVKLDERQRWHFYHPSHAAFVDEPHDHRYGFISHVVKGVLLNKVWVSTLEPGKGDIVSVSCKEGEDEPIVLHSDVNMTIGCSFDVSAGASYVMKPDAFHTVQPMFTHGPCVTTVIRDNVVKDRARVYRADPSAPRVCPFSEKLSDETLWAIVRKCLEP